MPFDLMEHNRELEGQEVRRRSSSGLSAATANRKSDVDERAELAKKEELRAQQEAIRKLDALQKAATSKPKPKPIPVEGGPLSSIQPPPRSPKPKSPGRGQGEWRCQTCSKRGTPETQGDCTCPADFKFCPTCGEAAGSGVPSDEPIQPVDGDWDCPNCNEPLSASFNYCLECGTVHPPPPPRDCAGCGETMPFSWKFCPDCGT
ncbi:MAG: hypothetical protein SGPRY_000207, partial [Prymnesium sp.]